MSNATTTTNRPVPAALTAAYHQFYIGLRIRQAKICFPLAMFLVPACAGLDYFVYPELAWPILKVRLWCSLGMVPFFLLLFHPWGSRHVRWFDSVPLIFATFAICWMIYIAEGPLSPYYAGLNIVMAAAILLVPYTLIEAVGICSFTMAAYVLACLMNRYHPLGDAGAALLPLSTSTLINNGYFLAMTALIALTSNHFSSRRRFDEFRLRYELDQNNVELANTIDKLKKTEVQLVQSEKMNALGKLSAGLLHEINNPLNFTFMALEVAEQEAGDNAGLKETLGDIGQGMGRIRGVIADLRAFAYPAKHSDASEFDVEESLTTALRLTSQELRDIVVDATAIRGLRARGVTSQVMHVFMNLLVNSAHAIRKREDGGRAGAIMITCTPHGDRLRIAVRDNGIGVAPEHLPRLFEPFFTTKQPGEGTGLGLSICHTIIENHGGTMAVRSELGHWTEVSFDLGAVAAQREAA